MYNNIEDQRKYHRERRATKRKEFFEGKSCAHCGSDQNLELDHIDSSTKLDHNVWTWGAERKLAELAKCQVLCHDCHLIKSQTSGDLSHPGSSNSNSKFTEEDVLAIRANPEKKTQVELAAEYGVTQAAISAIITRKNWSHI